MDHANGRMAGSIVAPSVLAIFAIFAMFPLACSTTGATPSWDTGSPQGDAAMVDGSSSPADGSGVGADGPTTADGGKPPSNDGGWVGQLDGAPDVNLGPPLPTLTNVTAVERDDSVGIDFDPVDNAVDYRVYPLPDPSDVTVNANGSVQIKNAIYRCAGLRQGYDLENNLNSNATLVTYNSPYNWKAQVDPNPTLGYVYITPAAGRIPVYAVAGYPPPAEKGGEAPELGWRESRFKIYTSDPAERAMLLGQNWRDDGIVFYVPATASAATQTIYASQKLVQTSNGAGDPFTQHLQYYFGAADQAKHASDSTPAAPAFEVLAAPDTSASPPSQPLMAVFYSMDQSHTELAVGKERYSRALNQGNGPLWHLEWAGLTQPTTLVVEALASGCPYQGFLSAQSLSAPPHQPFYTLGDIQAASPTGEVFINGEYDSVSAAPVPLARSFVQVAPQAHDPHAWDFYQGFNVGTDFGPVTMQTFPLTGMTTCNWAGCMGQTPAFDFTAYELDQVSNGNAVFTLGQFQGQLWEAFDDTGQDVTGRVRFTARQPATVAPNTFLHVTMSVNIVSTQRRYPQIIVTDQPSPIDCYSQTCNGIGNASSNTLLVQPINGTSMRLEAQAFHGLVNGAAWNVNNQAPAHALVDVDSLDMTVTGANMGIDPPFERAGMDRMTRFDAFVSSQKLYVFMDGMPVGCTTYPSGFALQGSVTVTFGDVLYHETADQVASNAALMSFIQRHQFSETTRHFDDLGFKSGVSASSDPLLATWDETKLPCGTY
jgi:hypothetical protein